MEAPLLAGESTTDPKTVRLGFVAGVIPQEKLIPFERLLFRATRGNMFLKSTAVGSVLDPTSGEKQEKAVFVVFFAGERARTKILKVGFIAWSTCCFEFSLFVSATLACYVCNDHYEWLDTHQGRHAPGLPFFVSLLYSKFIAYNSSLFWDVCYFH